MKWPPLEHEIADRWYVLHQSTAQIARALGESESTISRQLARIREIRRRTENP